MKKLLLFFCIYLYPIIAIAKTTLGGDPDDAFEAAGSMLDTIGEYAKTLGFKLTIIFTIGYSAYSGFLRKTVPWGALGIGITLAFIFKYAPDILSLADQ